MRTDLFWKYSMPRQDYNQHKAEHQEASLRNGPSWQSLCLTANTSVETGIDGTFFVVSVFVLFCFFPTQIKDCCQGEHLLIHRMHLCHVIYKDKAWLPLRSAFVVSLYESGSHVPKGSPCMWPPRDRRGGGGNTVTYMQACASLQMCLRNGDT